MNEDKILNLLGLAQRAGKVISGDFIVEKAIKRKEPKIGTYSLVTVQPIMKRNILN